MNNHTVSYSPEDDKLRMAPDGRLDATEYAEIKKHGFSWAPKQGVFYAIWTPARERLMMDWCGEIGDEDTTLVDRAEVRAARFEDYSNKRAHDAERAHKAVDSIAGNIPFGQPILVGHHSEKRARKDAQKIENGMRYAVKMWDTADYWARRAEAAKSHAKYMERSDVRARRIKGLESDARKYTKEIGRAKKALELWNNPEKELTLERSLQLANHPDFSPWGTWSDLKDGKITPEQARERVGIWANSNVFPHYCAWLQHAENRITYEKTMLAETGGLAADKFDFAVGGKVKHKWGWSIVKKLNKKDGVLLSLSLVATSYPTKVNVEDVKDYQPPTEEETTATKAATAKAPICNYRGEIALLNRYHGTTDTPRQMVEITQTEWNAVHADYKGTRDVPATDTTARHRVRIVCRGGSYPPVFITDAKEKSPPAPDTKQVKPALPSVPHELPQYREYVKPEPTKADELRATLKAGITAVSAPQLFPTPAPLAARMVEMAEIGPGMTVLEPSAGTGRIMQAIMNNDKADAVVAIEINKDLHWQLKKEYIVSDIYCMDFLQYDRSKYPVDRVIMNPPFINGADIKHINHAFSMLKPGGRLVAICAGGPRQEAQLKPLCDTWEPLPAGTFEESGTGVNSVLLTMSKAA